MAASRTLLQRLLACLKFILDADYSVGTNEINGFYELYQHKQLKTTEINENYYLILTMRDINIISNLNPLIKFSSHRSTGFRDTFSLNLSQMFTKSVPIYKKSHKLHDEKDIPF